MMNNNMTPEEREAQRQKQVQRLLEEISMYDISPSAEMPKEDSADMEIEATLPEETDQPVAPTTVEQTVQHIAPTMAEQTQSHLEPEEVQPTPIERENPPYVYPLIFGDGFVDEDEDEDFENDPEQSLAAEDVETNDLPLDQEPPKPRAARNPFAVIGHFFSDNFFSRRDGWSEWLRKSVFWLSLLTALVAFGYVLYIIWWVPTDNAHLNSEISEKYDRTVTDVISDTENGTYPEGMLASFKELYDANKDVRGWLTFQASGKDDFVHIDYPVMWSGNHTKYLRHDFNKKYNRNGTLFFDKSNRVNQATDTNRNLIIYGHNMSSGQMFAGLNNIIVDVDHARAATSILLSTLFEENEYEVFAVIVVDEDETGEWFYNYRRMSFGSDEKFLGFIAELRERSLFDYPVDVLPDDELLMLSTCASKSITKLQNGRTVVIARKVKYGDMPMDTSAIVKNDDALMPRAWYTARNLPLPAYYTAGTQPTLSTTGTTVSYATVTTQNPTGTYTTQPTGGSTTKRGSATSSRSVTNTTASQTSASGSHSTEPSVTEPTQPSETQPTETEPTETEPSETQSTATEPSETQPTETQPTEE